MKQLTVTGVGKTSETPDTVEIDFTLSVINQDYAACNAQSAVAFESLRQAVYRAGLQPDTLRTASFRLSARYEHKGGEKVFVGYECAHRLVLRFALDIPLLDAVMAELGDSGAYADFSVRFMLYDDRAVKNNLLQAAVADAAEKAATIASAAGKRLGDVVSITYGSGEPNLYSHTEYARPRLMAASLSVQPENVENVDSVTVVYELL